MKRVLTVTEASRNFADVINRVFYRGETALLLRAGEAVARIEPVGPDTKLGRDLADIWRRSEYLGPAEAECFAEDLNASKSMLVPPADRWD